MTRFALPRRPLVVLATLLALVAPAPASLAQDTTVQNPLVQETPGQESPAGDAPAQATPAQEGAARQAPAAATTVPEATAPAAPEPSKADAPVVEAPRIDSTKTEPTAGATTTEAAKAEVARQQPIQPGTPSAAPQLPPPETAVLSPDVQAGQSRSEARAERRRRGKRTAEPVLPPAMGVTVQNRSKPTLCAEDDNVYLTFSSGRVRHFRVDARPPAALGSIVVDSTAPDFTDCTIADQPPGPEDKVERIVLFEDDTMQLVGYRHAEFWRKGDVPLKVGEREEHALHLVQLFAKTPKGPYEYLVMYPLDGYWRARPLPPERLEQVAYGTSFLVGMVEEHERPVVAIKSIKFVPSVKSFELTYPKGDVATVRVTGFSEKATSVEVVFEKPVGNGKPFAAFRSMYITDVNADASHVFWKEPRAKGWGQRPVMDFRRAFASEIRLGRVAASQHNTSAPDTLVYDFMPD